MVHVGQRVVGIVEVSEQGGEGEHDHGDRDEHGADTSEEGRDGVLDIGGAFDIGSEMDAGGQAHESRRRAEEHGVDVDRKGLRKSLLDGVRDHGGGGGVRRGTDTGFVRVEASLDAVDEAGSGHAAEDGLEVEGVFEDDAEHVRDVLQIGDDDDEGDEDIEDAHGRNDRTRELDDPLAAAEDAVSGRDGEDGTDDGGGGLRVIERVRLEGGLQVVRAEQLEPEGVGHQ